MSRGLRIALVVILLPLFAAAARAQFDPLHVNSLVGSVKAGNYASVEQYLVSGESPNQIGENGASALIVASQTGHCDIAGLLLKHGARTDIKDRDGNTALMWAAELGQIACMQAIIAARADVNAADRQGATALMKAARGSRLDAIKLLIEAKADVTLTDFTGATALSYAEGARQRKAAEALRAAGARD